MNGAAMAPGSPVVVSIRPQEISLGAQAELNGHGPYNVLKGRIVRHAYLGEARDYLVGVVGTDLTLRVITTPKQLFKLDQSVCLTIAADACRVIPSSSGS